MFDDAQLKRLLFLLTNQWLSQETDEEVCRSWELFQDTVREIRSQDELHVLAALLNWDDGLEGIRSVAEHPQCDRGTVLMLFWLGAPECDSNRDPEEVALLRFLEDRYLQDDFVHRSIAYDPRDDADASSVGKLSNVMALPCSGADRRELVNAVDLLVTCEWYRRGHLRTFPSPENPAIMARTGGVPDREVVRILNRHGRDGRFRDMVAAEVRALAVARIRCCHD